MPTDKQVHEAIESFAVRVRHALDTDVRSLADELVRIGHQGEAHWRSEMDRAVEGARADAEQAFIPRLEELRDRLRRAQAIPRLLASIRRLDESRSLHAILEALAAGAPGHVARVAMLLVAGDRLRVWRHSGFQPNSVSAEVPISESGVLRTTVALREASLITSGAGERDANLPAFMDVPRGHTGCLVPVIVGTEVVALLYADAADEQAEHDAGRPAWADELEVLARHASVRLEIVTSVRTAEMLTSPA